MPRVKLLGIYFLHIFKRRYIGVFFDPVLACNLRCKMCHFSDDEQRKEMKGIMSEEKVRKIADGFFRRALKLQIGCAAEPTLYKDLPGIVRMAKERGVPFVSMITNGNLLTEETLHGCLSAGLDEIIISLHGVKKETYESLMTNGNYEKFHEALKIMSDAKDKFNFKLRINYTINEDNVEELSEFFDKFNDLKLDVLQLRPIQKFGETAYQNFSHDKIIEHYDTSIKKVVDEAVNRNITCIAPTFGQMVVEDNHNDNAVIFKSTYCYISPKSAWRPDFDMDNDTYDSYCKKHHWARVLLTKHVFGSLDKLSRRKKHLNYEIN